jgi:predicted enzyme related to lactoylglutathione lyase
MKNYLGRVVVLVDDYEAAADFYSKNFGFQKIFDQTTETGQRFLHMGSGGQNEMAIWFLQADAGAEQALVGRQTGGQPMLVIYTDNLEELYGRLRSNGVRIQKEPVISPDYKFFHCLDHLENELIVVELAS